MFSREDLVQIKEQGLGTGEVIKQLEYFRRGVSPLRLVRPCRVGDGIIRLPESAYPELLALQREAAAAGRFSVFVPASGAASRMFEKWQGAALGDCFGNGGEIDEWRGNLTRYPFYDDLVEVAFRRGIPIGAGHVPPMDILNLILSRDGLGYATMPKALIKFHQYPDGSRTALAEQLWEGTSYLACQEGQCRYHFTVPSNYLEAIRQETERTARKIMQATGLVVQADFSCQHSDTDTIAVDADGRPFRDAKGRLFFRPGGHGALLANLQASGGDIVHVKNIDNVAREENREVGILFKKILGGYFIWQEKRIEQLLMRLTGPGWKDALDEVSDYVKSTLCLREGEDFTGREPEWRRERFKEVLSRPLRLAGVVKNQGEPGGGPFFVTDSSGKGESPQIVEGVQVNLQDPSQALCLTQATHFNPVDLVCGLRHRDGEPFELRRYVDEGTCLISKKSREGRQLWVLEWPGLWNGGMAFWNSIFVEVPIDTFNPVKTVEDLLRPAHLGNRGK